MISVSALLKQLVLPPASIISILVVGLVLGDRFGGLGRRVGYVAAVALFVLSTPIASAMLMRLVQAPNETDTTAQAIVILAAGVTGDASEYGGTATADALTLERLRYGATLYRETKLPILVAGGVLDDATPAAAFVMSQILATDYAIKVRWIEAKSRNTEENAMLSAAVLRASGVKRIYLVTHAWHMARARLWFEREGFVVAAAGTGFRRPPSLSIDIFLPSVRALNDSYYALHELIGLAFYSFAA